MRSIPLALAALLGSTALASAQDVTLRVHYAIPTIWADTQDLLAAAFMEANPDVAVEIDAPAETYEDGVQRLLREAIAGTGPDIAYVGLNNWRILEDRGLLQPLDPFIGDAAAFEAAGYTPALRSLGQYESTQWALATSASTLVVYANPALLEQAGVSMDDLGTFEGIEAAATEIEALGDTVDGAWIAPHDWRFQSLLGSYGGRPLTADESDVAFDDAAGKSAAEVYAALGATGMGSYGGDEARQAFAAGTLGLYIDSSSYLTGMEEGAGDRFDVTVLPLPVAAEDAASVYFPTGGSALVMLAEDEAVQQAAWDYMTFVTGPEGAKIVVENTGYAPTNAIVLGDESYLGAFYEQNPNARVAHAQVAAHAGPWYAYPGAEGVAVTDQIAAALVEVVEGAEPGTRIDALAEQVRGELGMD